MVCDCCKLIGLSIHASPVLTVLLLRFMGLFPLILRPHCAATETMTLVKVESHMERVYELLPAFEKSDKSSKRR